MEYWSIGEMNFWSGVIICKRIIGQESRYQQLRVWEDAIDFYVANARIFRSFPYELKRVASQAIASADSVHRNIAEGYCRRSDSRIHPVSLYCVVVAWRVCVGVARLPGKLSS